MHKNRSYILITLLSLSIVFVFSIISVVFCSLIKLILNSFKISDSDVLFWLGIIFLIFSYSITDKSRKRIIEAQHLTKCEKRFLFRCTAVILSLIQLVEIPLLIKDSLYPDYLFFSLSNIIVIIMMFRTANWCVIGDNIDKN